MPHAQKNYISSVEALAIHARIVDKTGGSHGVRDIGLLESALGRPVQSFGGKELYETVFEKAGALFESLIMNHPFVDGNKRTAVTLAIRFLYKNGYIFKAEKGEIEQFTVSVVTEKLSIQDIAAWLGSHVEEA